MVLVRPRDLLCLLVLGPTWFFSAGFGVSAGAAPQMAISHFVSGDMNSWATAMTGGRQETLGVVIRPCVEAIEGGHSDMANVRPGGL